MRIALGTLDIQEAFSAGSAAFVDHHHVAGHQFVLLDNGIREPRHLIGAPAGACRNDELHGFAGFPVLCPGLPDQTQQNYE